MYHYNRYDPFGRLTRFCLFVHSKAAGMRLISAWIVLSLKLEDTAQQIKKKLPKQKRTEGLSDAPEVWTRLVL